MTAPYAYLESEGYGSGTENCEYSYSSQAGTYSVIVCESEEDEEWPGSGGGPPGGGSGGSGYETGNPCDEVIKVNAMYSGGTFDYQYDDLKSKYNASVEWGVGLWAIKGSSEVIMLDDISPGPSQIEWELNYGYIVDEEDDYFTIGWMHSHPSGTENPPSAVDVVGMAELFEENSMYLSQGRISSDDYQYSWKTIWC